MHLKSIIWFGTFHAAVYCPFTPCSTRHGMQVHHFWSIFQVIIYDFEFRRMVEELRFIRMAIISEGKLQSQAPMPMEGIMLTRFESKPAFAYESMAWLRLTLKLYFVRPLNRIALSISVYLSDGALHRLPHLCERARARFAEQGERVCLCNIKSTTSAKWVWIGNMDIRCDDTMIARKFSRCTFSPPPKRTANISLSILCVCVFRCNFRYQRRIADGAGENTNKKNAWKRNYRHYFWW